MRAWLPLNAVMSTILSNCSAPVTWMSTLRTWSRTPGSRLMVRFTPNPVGSAVVPPQPEPAISAPSKQVASSPADDAFGLREAVRGGVIRSRRAFISGSPYFAPGPKSGAVLQAVLERPDNRTTAILPAATAPTAVQNHHFL